MNKMCGKLLVGALVASLAGVSMAQDQVSMGGRPLRMTSINPKNMGLNSTDRKAVKEMAQGHMAEIMNGKLAMNRAGGEWAREFGKEMVHEHGIALAELKLLARKKGIHLPSGPSAEGREMYHHLAMLHGSAFDRAYRTMMLQDHKEDEAKIRLAMRFGRDADVRGYEVKLLPQVVEHKRLVQLRRTMMGATKLTSNKA